MSEAPVFSRKQVEEFVPDFGTAEDPKPSPRTYRIAPLTFRERQAFQSDMTKEGASGASDREMFEAVRSALREVRFENTDEMLAAVDAAEAAPKDPEAQAPLGPILSAISDVPVYSAVVAARQRRLAMLPYVAARHALRGWSGPSLPEFKRRAGQVPDELLEQFLETVPEAETELQTVGWKAVLLMQPGPAAGPTSEGLSPSPETPSASPEG